MRFPSWKSGAPARTDGAPTNRSPYEATTCYLLALATFLLDQGSKLAIVGAIALGHSHPLIDGYLNFTYVQNLGSAFSLFWGHSSALALVAIGIASALVVYERLAPQRSPALLLGLGLVLGGALGNFADRVMLGYVRDMVDVRWQGANIFPIFNVADMAVCVGVALLIWHQATATAVPARIAAR